MRSFLSSLFKTLLPISLATVILSTVFLFSPVLVYGANLSLSPASGSYEVGTVLTVAIKVSSPNQAVNAVSGVVSYPTDAIELISLSKNQSIISLWVQEPSFSNTEGTINFEGIVLNPGFSGSSGQILNANFKVKSEGNPVITFVDGSVLANDGEGSEILSGKGKAQFSIVAMSTEDPQLSIEGDFPRIDNVETNQDQLPTPTSASVPVISSEVYPENGWSNQTSGSFNFNFSSDVTALRLLLDDRPNSIPTVVYEPPISSRNIDDLAEGVSYLHVQYRDANGWGDILHYKIQIDTKAPESFSIKEVVPGTFLFVAKDEASAVTRYEIQINDGETYDYTDNGDDLYRAPDLPAGTHIMSVKAFDAAGNYITISKQFVVTVPVQSETKPVEEITANAAFPDSNFILTKGTIFIAVLSVIIPSLALILLLGALLYASWCSVGGLRRRVEKEVREANSVIERAFLLLKSDLQVDVETLKKANVKRKLTREEAKILKRLQKNLDEAEKVISKEVNDIEDELAAK